MICALTHHVAVCSPAPIDVGPGKCLLGMLRDVPGRTQYGRFSDSATEENSLGPFLGFDADEEQDSLDCHDTLFPSDGLMFEDDVVQDGDIDHREHGDPSGQMDQKRNLFRQTSYIHCVKYFLDFGCMRKNERRMLTISQARNSVNQVKQTNVVARARKTSSQSLISSDHLAFSNNQSTGCKLLISNRPSRV